MSKPTLAQLLAESARNAANDNSEKKWSDLKANFGKPSEHKHRAEEQGVCPACGYASSLDDFDAGDDSQGDDYRPDDVTGESAADDPDNEGDRPNVAQRNRPTDRLALLQRSMKEANR